MPRRAHRVVTLTMNPAVDLSMTTDAITPGRKLRCQAVRRDPGGGGVNVARAIRRLGGRPLAVFPAGGPEGERLSAMLKSEGVATVAVAIAGETREDVTVEDLATGQEFRFVTPGPSLRRSELAAVQGRVEAELSRHGDIWVASGSLPPGAPRGFYAHLAVEARRRGVRLALDTTGTPLRLALSAGVWLIKPNLAELEEAHGGPLPDLESRLSACRNCIARGGAALVALSLGPEGALLVSSDAAWFARAPHITPVSTVGAGDSFLAGLVLALASGATEPEALLLATAAGASALMASGTQLCRRSDVEALSQRVRVRQVWRSTAVTATRSQRAAV